MRRQRPEGSRRGPRSAGLVAAAAAGVVVVVGAWALAADGPTEFKLVVKAESSGDNVVTLDGKRFAEAVPALQAAVGAKLMTLPVIPAGQLTSDTATLHVNETARTIAVKGGATDVGGNTATLLVTATWEDTDDTQPDIAVLLARSATTLRALNSGYAGPEVRLSKAWTAVANRTHEVAVANLPSGVAALLSDGVDSTTDDFPVTADAVAFRGVADVKDSAGALAAALALLDSRSTRPTELRVEGTLAADRSMFALVPGARTEGMTLRATGVGIHPKATAPSWLSLGSSARLDLTSGATGGASLSGRATATLDGDAHTGEATLRLLTEAGKPKAGLTSTLDGGLENVLGRAWVDLTELGLSGTLDDTSFAASITGKSSFAGQTARASFEPVASSKDKGTVTFDVAVGTSVTTATFLAAIDAVNAEAFGDAAAFATKLPSGLREGLGVGFDGFKVLVSNVGDSVVSALASMSLPTSPLGVGDMLLRASGSDLLLGAGVSKTASLAEVLNVKSSALAVDIPLERAAIVFRTGQLPVTDLDALSKSFFEPQNCGAYIEVCAGTLPINGVTLMGKAKLPDQLINGLSKIGVKVEGSVRAYGYVPLFGDVNNAIEITLDLPTVTFGEALGKAGTFVQAGDVDLVTSASRTGNTLEFSQQVTGTLTLGIPRAIATDCASPAKKEKVNDVELCIDAVEFQLTRTAGGKLSGTDTELSMELRLGTAEWAKPFGLPWVSLKNVNGVFGLSATTAGLTGATLGYSGVIDLSALGLTQHATGAVLMTVSPQPPFIELKGITRAVSNVGLSDLVTLAHSVATSDSKIVAANLGLPTDLSVRNVFFSYGTVLETDLCLRPGLRLQAELHLGKAPIGGSPQCIPDSTASEVVAQCQGVPIGIGGLSEPPSCIGQVFLDVMMGGAPAISGAGFMRGRDLKVLKLEDSKLLFDLSASAAKLAIRGGGTIRDPVDVANRVPAPRILGTGKVDISLQAETMNGVSQNTSKLKGEVALSGSLVEAYVEGRGKADLADPDFTFEVFLRGTGLDVVTDAIDNGVADTAKAAKEMQALVSRAFADGAQGAQEALQATAAAFERLGASVPQTASDITSKISTITGMVNGASSTVDSWLGNLADTASKAGISWFSSSLNDFRNRLNGEAANVVHAALHGVDLPDFAGIRIGKWVIESPFPDVPDTEFCPFNLPERDGGCELVPSITLPNVEGVCQRLPARTDLCDRAKDTKQAVVDGVVSREALDLVKTRSGTTLLTPEGLGTTLKQAATAFDGETVAAKCAVFQVTDATATGAAVLSDATLHIDAVGADVRARAPLAFSGGSLLSQTASGGLVTASFEQAAGLSQPGSGKCDAERVPAGKVVETNPLTVSLKPLRTVNEGESVTLTGTVAGTGAESAKVVVTWGEGAPVTVTPKAADGTVGFSATHTYADDTGPGSTNRFLVRATVEGTTATATTLVTVTNLNPTVSIDSLSGDEAGLREGTPVTLSVRVADAGKADTHALAVDWGDGSPRAVAPAASLSAGASTTTFTHAFADDGAFTIRVSGLDKDGGSAATTRKVVVANVAPTVSALRKVAVLGGADVTGAGNAVAEGALVRYEATVTDPGVRDVATVAVAWGDGTSETTKVVGQVGGPEQRVVSLVHGYSDDNPTATPSDVVTVSLDSSDDDGGDGAEVKTDVTVHNITPHIAAATLQVDGTPLSVGQDGRYRLQENQAPLELRLAWSDVGQPDTHSVTIDWGAGWGTTTAGPTPTNSANPWWSVDVNGADVRSTTLADSGRSRELRATNRYGDNGTYDIAITVKDDDLGIVTRTLTLVVENVVPTVTIDESVHVGVAGKAFMAREDAAVDIVADSDDRGSDDLSFTWTTGDGATVGPRLHRLIDGVDDPRPSPQVRPRVAVKDLLTHQWTEPCLYETSVTVTDDDGGTARDTTFIAVIAAPGARQQSSGWWGEQFRNAGLANAPRDVPSERLDCYVRIADHLSSVFDGLDRDGARRVLEVQPDGVRDPLQRERELLDRRLLTAWLNLTNGVWDWHTSVEDSDGDRTLDVTLGRLITEVEEVRRTSTDSAALTGASTRLVRIRIN